LSSFAFAEKEFFCQEELCRSGAGSEMVHSLGSSVSRNFRFLIRPLNFARLIGESRKIFRNTSSVSSSQSLVEQFRIKGRGLNASSRVGCENLFHGQTS